MSFVNPQQMGVIDQLLCSKLVYACVSFSPAQGAMFLGESRGPLSDMLEWCIKENLSVQ